MTSGNMTTCAKRRFDDFPLRFILAVGCILMAAGCGVPEKRPEDKKIPAMVRLEKSDYPTFSDDMNFDGLDHCITSSLLYLSKRPDTQKFSFADDKYSVAHMIRSLESFQQFIQTSPSASELRQFVAEKYQVYRSSGDKNNGKVLFTGYYEPLLKGSLVRNDVYRFPIWARPDDHLIVKLATFSSKFIGESIIGRVDGGQFVPYYDRKDIENGGVLAGKAPVLAWLDNPVDVFFLHIQGSGKIFLDTGQSINVHYDTTNGRPYRSIGRHLIDKGAIPKDKMSMQAIRRYLDDNPHAVDAVLNTNPSYVFFKLEADGPLGFLGVKLTPGRSIATDRRIFPKAALSFIETKQPLIDAKGRIQKWAELNRFVLNQDTGGAIRGPGRADLFWGNGPYAELAAGHMQHRGSMYFLVLKQ